MITNKYREALEDAARSLETIATRAGSDDLLTHWGDVRAYAANRALTARATLAQPAEPAALTDEEITEIWDQTASGAGLVLRFARAIERAIRSKT